MVQDSYFEEYAINFSFVTCLLQIRQFRSDQEQDQHKQNRVEVLPLSLHISYSVVVALT